MSEIKQLEGDLGYVRGVVRKAGVAQSPAAINILWAVIVLVGFALNDFAQTRAGLYWLIAAPFGFLLSLYLGWRSARQQGQIDKQEGVRHTLHWGGMMVAIFLAVPLGATGALTPKGMGQAILLIVGLAYFLAGVHLERPMLWIGISIAAGYLATFVITKYTWTIVGAFFAAALIASALLGGRKSATAPN